MFVFASFDSSSFDSSFDSSGVLINTCQKIFRLLNIFAEAMFQLYYIKHVMLNYIFEVQIKYYHHFSTASKINDNVNLCYINNFHHEQYSK